MNDPKVIRNAVISGASITDDDHGVLMAWLHLDYGSGGAQGFGGYVLYSPGRITDPNFAGHFLWRCLKIAGVERWDQLPGKTVRVLSDWGKVYKIGHIVNDDWFDPSEDFASVKTETKND